MFSIAEPVGFGLWLDSVSGQFFVGEGLALLLGGVVWVGGILAGLLTAWLTLP